MKNLKFSTKFVLVFGIIILMIILNTFRVNSTLNKISNETEKNIEYAKFSDEIHMAYIAHLEWARKIDAAIISKDMSILNNVQGNYRECHLGKWYYSEERAELEQLLPDFKELLAQLDEPHSKLHSSLENLKQVATGDSLDINQVLAVYNSDTKIHLNQVVVILHQLEQKTDSFGIDGGSVNEKLFEYVAQEKIYEWIFNVIIILLSILLGYIISANIINSVNKTVAFSQSMAKGDLTEELDVDQKDEIGILANEFEKMTKKIEQVIEAIKESSAQISGGADEMNNNSQMISQGANEQASSIEEISSAIEQMTATINQNTEQAVKAQRISEESSEEMQESSKVMIQAIDAMKEIAQNISVISEIADKTDMLAINAAVEAARAGEEGRGFAVVANEIRKLAENTQNAAKKIENLTKNSVKIADTAGEELMKIVPKIQKTSQYVKEISTASIEQNSSANEISNSINQFNQVTQQTAASTEELAASIEQLTSQAEQLFEIVSFFKTKSQNSFSTKKKTSFVSNKKTKNYSANDNFDNDFEKF